MKQYKVIDESYTVKALGDNEFEPTYGINLQTEKWEILATDCDLPGSYSTHKEYNNTIIRGVSSGNIIFIQKRFLKELCPYCGK